MVKQDKNFEKYVNNVAENIHHSFLKKIGNLYLNADEISILDKYNIDYKNCNDYNSLLYLIDDILDYEDYEDLEVISKDISERNYYLYTKK